MNKPVIEGVLPISFNGKMNKKLKLLIQKLIDDSLHAQVIQNSFFAQEIYYSPKYGAVCFESPHIMVVARNKTLIAADELMAIFDDYFRDETFLSPVASEYLFAFEDYSTKHSMIYQQAENFLRVFRDVMKEPFDYEIVEHDDAIQLKIINITSSAILKKINHFFCSSLAPYLCHYYSGVISDNIDLKIKTNSQIKKAESEFYALNSLSDKTIKRM